MRRAVLLVLFGPCVLIAAVAWLAPATLAEKALEHLTGDRIVLAEAQGTLWNGHGTIAAAGARVPVAWVIHPTALLRGEIAITLLPAPPGATTPRGEIVVGESDTRLRDFAVDIPAAIIAEAAITRPRLTATGVVELSGAALDWTANAGSGGLSASWHHAGLGLAGAAPIALGEVSTSLTMRDGALSGPIRSSGGDVSIEGELTVRAGGAGSIRGVVQARRSDDPRIEALRAIGTPQGSGVRVDWQWPGR